MRRQSRFRAQVLLAVVSAAAWLFGVIVLHRKLNVAHDEEVERLFSELSEDAPQPGWQFGQNSDVLRSNEDTSTFGYDLGDLADRNLMRFGLHEDGAYGYGRVATEPVIGLEGLGLDSDLIPRSPNPTVLEDALRARQ